MVKGFDHLVKSIGYSGIKKGGTQSRGVHPFTQELLSGFLGVLSNANALR
jgi:hypothetical protein